MGGALYAALDGRQQMSNPAIKLKELINRGDASSVERGDRVVSVVALEPSREKILLVPTVTKSGDSNVIRKKPFAFASAPLAVAPTRNTKYPAFNPLTVFRPSKIDNTVVSSDVIYSANVEGEVTVSSEQFPLKTAVYNTAVEISANEAAMAVKEIMGSIEEGATQVAALPYLDTGRFSSVEEEIFSPASLGIKVTAENVTRIPMQDTENVEDRFFSEEVLVITRKQKIQEALDGLKANEGTVDGIAKALAEELGSEEVEKGTRIWIVWERASENDLIELRRVSIYRQGEHEISVAINDAGNVVTASEPAQIPATAVNDEEEVVQTVSRGNLPSAYDGIYRAALSQGLSKDHAQRIVRTVAFDVDFRSTISAKDELEVFYSVEEGQEAATDNSEILYIGLTLKGVKRRYYRFKARDNGEVDYYDETGKSAKKFLLRKPVPNGKFRSGFGPRRHPISRRIKMHNGVDFSAPSGTPIVAAGNGVVEEAGWGGGCGKRTILRHANGYKTIYCHQRRFAKGVRAGARVRQGQIIGQVGSTGYSTGPHLHYEVVVNGRKVNPMRIRLPKGRVLSGKTLKSFKRERARIDALLERSRGKETTLASL